jgi:rhodanese-related sulfurtransferase
VTISSTELAALLRQDSVVLLDVRPAVEYRAGHIPDAISSAYGELPDRLEALPGDKPVVAYCRGPYCAYADDALGVLASHGFLVARLEEGVVEWQLAADL